MTAFWLTYIGAGVYILLCNLHLHRDPRRPR